MKMLLGILIAVIGLGITGFGVMTAVKSGQKETAPEPESEVLPEKEENYKKGLKFEEYTVSLFDKKYFDIVEWRGDKQSQDGRSAKSNQLPDLEMQLNLRNASHRFAVECKWRQHVAEEFEWTYPAQLKRYRSFATEHDMPVFIVLGVGGTPDNPKYINAIPLSAIAGVKLATKNLKPYSRRKPDASFYYDAEAQKLTWRMNK